MARPKKEPQEKRDKRLTLYLTGQEREQLQILSESTGLDKTKIIARALRDYIKTLEDPPSVLRKERQHEIMRAEQEQVSGYVCMNGHLLWLEWTWPSPPTYCPCCGADEFKSTWAGVVKKGLNW